MGIAFLVTIYGLNWRLAFWFGAGVAVVGMAARTTLRETPEFADAKRSVSKSLHKLDNNEPNTDVDYITQYSMEVREQVSWKTVISLLLVDCIWPVTFYFTFVHCTNILKYSFNYTAEQIINNNFIVSFMVVGNDAFVLYFSSKIHQLSILKVRLILSSIYFLVVPFLLNNAESGVHILIVQSLILIVACDAAPANSVFFKHFPVFKRFTYASVIYATSRALVYLITSVSLVYLTECFSQWGLYFITIPTIIGCAYGLSYFIKLEKNTGNFSGKKIAVDSVINID
ncbi:MULTISPECIES: MFS transporter [unclassified Candidatus Tisiphia]|uniref:MFS transporter n=1 Tax=unclassified Candidatus Tisiphia TaxID=2996318 RepID=UPI00312CAF38